MKRIEFNAHIGIGNERVLDNIRLNIARNIPLLNEMSPPKRGRLNIVAGGPSVKDTIKIIKKRKRNGEKIACVNGAYKYLVDNRIIPDMALALDADPIVADFYRQPRKETTFYVASMCDTSVFDSLDKHNVIMWHADQGIGEGDITEADLRISGGSTAALRWMNVGFVLGYRDFHYFGLDSCHKDKLHVYDKEDASAEALEIHCAGRDFLCTPDMAEQAQAFQKMVSRFGHLFNVKIYGDGLISHMMKVAHRSYYAS